MNISPFVFVLAACSLSLSSCFNQVKKEPEPFCGVKDPAPVNGNGSETQIPQVFSAKCATCHTLDKNLTGPGLKHVLKRVPSENWFDQFVRNEDSLMRAGDDYTLEIQQWSPVAYKHQNSQLTDEQLNEIKAYLSRT